METWNNKLNIINRIKRIFTKINHKKPTTKQYPDKVNDKGTKQLQQNFNILPKIEIIKGS